MKYTSEFSDATLAASVALDGRPPEGIRPVSRIAFSVPVGSGAYWLRDLALWRGFGLEAEFASQTDPPTTIRVGCAGQLPAPSDAGGLVTRSIFRLYKSPAPQARQQVFDYLPEFTRKDGKVFPARGHLAEVAFPVIFDLQNPQNPKILHGKLPIPRQPRLNHYFDRCGEFMSILSSFVADINPDTFPFATEPELRETLTSARLALTREQTGGKVVSPDAHNFTPAGTAAKGNK